MSRIQLRVELIIYGILCMRHLLANIIYSGNVHDISVFTFMLEDLVICFKINCFADLGTHFFSDFGLCYLSSLGTLSELTDNIIRHGTLSQLTYNRIRHGHWCILTYIRSQGWRIWLQLVYDGGVWQEGTVKLLLYLCQPKWVIFTIQTSTRSLST